MNLWLRKARAVAMLAAAVAVTLTPLASAQAQTQAREAAMALDGGFPAGARFGHHFFQPLCVNPGGTYGCETTISAAVARMTNESVVITVAPGTYTDNVGVSAAPNLKTVNVSIEGTSGSGVTIVNGNDQGPVFAIGPNANVELSGLTITDGIGGAVQEGTGGGGILAAGGSLTVLNCLVSDNQAGFGAGIYQADGDLLVASSSITGNAAGDDAQGGGIYFAASKGHKIEIDDSTIDGNSASVGGGLAVSGGLPVRSNAYIFDSTISNNSSSGAEGGAGLYIAAAKLIMLNTTISGNNATGSDSSGGGIQAALTDASLDNVTITNNSAAGSGGGIDANIIAGVFGSKKITISRTRTSLSPIP
jgi:hypothetical protein